MSRKRSASCRCPLCTGQVDPDEAIRAYARDEYGHDLGCDCPKCESVTLAEVRDALECDYETGVASWLADIYLAVIEPGRCDLLRAPQWARTLAVIGDRERNRVQEKRSKRMRRKRRQQSSSSTPGPGLPRGG